MADHLTVYTGDIRKCTHIIDRRLDTQTPSAVSSEHRYYISSDAELLRSSLTNIVRFAWVSERYPVNSELYYESGVLYWTSQN